MAAGLAGGFPIANTILANLTGEWPSAITFGELYLVVILVSVFVCTLAIQGAATRMMFSMGRDRHLPLGATVGQRQPDVQDPGQRRHRRRRARRPAHPAGRPDWRLHALDRRHRPDLHELLPVQPGRGHGPHKGWPHKAAWFNLGSWGMLVNILALIYGARDDHQHRAVERRESFGDFGTENRGCGTRSSTACSSSSASRSKAAGVATVRDHRRPAPGHRAHLLLGRRAR